MKKLSCLIIGNSTASQKIQHALGDKFIISTANSTEDSANSLRSSSLNCIIAYISDECIELRLRQILYFKLQFSIIPLIGVIHVSDLDLIRRCGKRGIDKVISYEDLSVLKQSVIRITNTLPVQVSLRDLGLNNMDVYSPLVKKALEIMQEYYPSLKTVEVIANLVGASKEILTREFKKHNLIPPKRLLTYLKIKQATLLMHNQDLNLSEIACGSGFSDLRRFNECFHRIFNCSPSDFRIHRTHHYLDAFWMNCGKNSGRY
jgi:AraC-like DNA-binding protein